MSKTPFALIACLALCACSDPTPTPTPDPPEPQTAAVATTAGKGHTELRDAIQVPLEKARSVEVTLQDGAAQRDQALEDASD